MLLPVRSALRHYRTKIKVTTEVIIFSSLVKIKNGRTEALPLDSWFYFVDIYLPLYVVWIYIFPDCDNVEKEQAS
jgi:hypothetical protein